jgi:UDP-N-acetylglucosamine 1-carboxyvinyltransferase
MTRLRIEGGHEISGTVKVRGNKNAVLPMIAASLLTDEAIILHNVPNILDVSSMLDIAASLGVEIRRDNTTLYLRAGNIKTTVIPAKFCSSTRSSFLFSGPLLARCGSATICAPGGDMIGRRRLDAHFYGLASLGAKVDGDSYPLIFETSGLQGRELFF